MELSKRRYQKLLIVIFMDLLDLYTDYRVSDDQVIQYWNGNQIHIGCAAAWVALHAHRSLVIGRPIVSLPCPSLVSSFANSLFFCPLLVGVVWSTTSSTADAAPQMLWATCAKTHSSTSSKIVPLEYLPGSIPIVEWSHSSESVELPQEIIYWKYWLITSATSDGPISSSDWHFRTFQGGPG